MDELRVAMARQRHQPQQHRQAEPGRVGQEAVQHRWVVDGLGHDEGGAGRYLLLEAAKFAIIVERGRFRATGHRKAGLPLHCPSRRIDASIEARHHAETADRVEVIHRRSMRVVTHLRRVAGYDHQVVQAQRVIGEQVGLQAEQVAIAHAEMHQRLHAKLAPHLQCQCPVGHADRGPRTISDVDHIHAGRLQHPRRLYRPCRIEPRRRVHLHRDRKALG